MSTQDAPWPAAPRVPGAAPRVLLVQAPYYRDVVDGLQEGARRILAEAGAQVVVLDVAGAFELPQAIRLAVAAGSGFDGYVALGCVVRGGTDHYEFICQATMQGLMQVALEHALAMGAGLLTVADIGQARARASADGHNKGAEAAAACLLQIAAARHLQGVVHGA